MSDDNTLVNQILRDLREVRPFAPYPTEPPHSVAAAYALQDKVVAALTAGAPGAIGGWKIAANLPAMMDRFGLSEPLCARVLAADRRDSPALLRAADYRQFAFEPEIAAVMGATLAPEGAPFAPERVRAAIARFVPSMELLDMRGADMGAIHIADTVAQNILNAGAVLGGPGVAPDALDPAGIRTRLIIDGETRHDVTGAAPQHPLETVTWLANHLAGRGLALEAGQVVLCGTHSPIWHHAGPGAIIVEMSGLGSVSARLE